MATLSTGGLGSGLDINTMVSQLVAAERGPTDTRLANMEAQLQAKISAVGTVKSAFSDFRTSLAALRTPSSLDKVSASSSDTSILTASADSTAKIGSYALTVKALAQADIQGSQGFSGTGAVVMAAVPQTLTIQVGTASKDITIDSSNNTLAGIRDAINAAGTGATASIVNDGGANGYHLLLKSNSTGVSNAITVTDPSASLTFTSKQAAQDALVNINGMDISSASNTLSTAVDGVTFNLAQAQPSKTVNVSVAADSSNFSSSVKALVDKYNAVVDAVKQVSSYDPASKQAGPLLSDSGVRTAFGQIRSIMGQAVSGLSGSVTSARDVGITTQQDGKLAFDTAKFNSAFSANKDNVIALFTSDNGLSNRLDTALGGIVGTGGLLDARSSGLQKSVDQIGKDKDALNTRMTTYQARLLKQFNAMDQLVGQLNSTGSAFSQQMTALTNASK